MTPKSFALAVALVVALSGTAGAVTIDYLAPTGQTAQADFSFTNATHLQIILRETTLAAASTLTGGDAILTGIGFLLPDSAVIVLPGTVNICSTALCGSNSSSVGFSGGAFGAGANVSAEWGATIGGEKPIGNGSSFDFVSVIEAQVTQFSGTNRDGPAGLNGPQGGLLDDSAAQGGLGVIDNSVRILLTLDENPLTAGNQGLSAAQQSAFLTSIYTQSVVKWGSESAYGNPVPEPGTLLLLGSGLSGLAACGWRRRSRVDG